MWITYLLTFIAGCLISVVVNSITNLVANKDKYTKREFKEKLGKRVGGLAWVSVLATLIVMSNAIVVVDEHEKKTNARIEYLEEQVKDLKSLNQVDTIGFHSFIGENDLK